MARKFDPASKEYRLAYADSISANAARYYQKHKEKRKANSVAWARKFKEKYGAMPGSKYKIGTLVQFGPLKAHICGVGYRRGSTRFFPIQLENGLGTTLVGSKEVKVLYWDQEVADQLIQKLQLPS